MKCKVLITGLIFLNTLTVIPQNVTVVSPNQKVKVTLLNRQNADVGEWYLKVSYLNNGKSLEAIPQINLGLSRSDQDFSKELKFLKAGNSLPINEQYTALHGKRSQCSNSANEIIIFFENPG